MDGGAFGSRWGGLRKRRGEPRQGAERDGAHGGGRRRRAHRGACPDAQRVDRRAEGCASTADFSERSLEAAVQAAVDIARVSAEDPAAGLPEAEDLQADMRDLSLWHPFEGGVQEAVRLASAVEEAVFEADERIVNSDGTNFSTSSGEFTLATSLGFCAGYRYSRHDMDAAPIAEDDSGMQRDGWWTQGRAVEDLSGPRRARTHGCRAHGRSPWRKAAVEPSCAGVFDAPVATGLLDILEELLNGRAWYRHASCLEGRLGERILPAHVSVEEDPYLMRALGSGVFDDEGCAGRRRMIVSDGRIEGIFLSSYSARRLGMRTTGNLGGAYNLRLSSAETRPEDTRRAMLERLGTGFLVTELIGQGLNAVSGDYSRGASASGSRTADRRPRRRGDHCLEHSHDDEDDRGDRSRRTRHGRASIGKPADSRSDARGRMSSDE